MAKQCAPKSNQEKRYAASRGEATKIAADSLSAAIWQGKKASNPRPTVLETVALPTELFPYMSLFGGPSGT